MEVLEMRSQDEAMPTSFEAMPTSFEAMSSTQGPSQEEAITSIYIHSSDSEVSTSSLLNLNQAPVFKVLERGLKAKEILKLIVFKDFDEDILSTTVPIAQDNSIFIVDLNAVDADDLTSDEAGKYDGYHDPYTIIRAFYHNGEFHHTKILQNKKLEDGDPLLRDPNVFTLMRKYCDRKDDNNKIVGKRIISRIHQNNQFFRFAIVQFIGTISLRDQPHGNSKNFSNRYGRTKKSVLRRAKELVKGHPPRQVVNQLDAEAGGVFDFSSPSDCVRNRAQVYNIKKSVPDARKFRNSGRQKMTDFNKLLANVSNSPFLKDVSVFSRGDDDAVKTNTFAATSNAISMLKSFCTPDSDIRQPVYIDMTYKIGQFYTTCMSFANPVVVHHRTNVHPTTILAVMTSMTRVTADYRFLANNIKSLGINTLIYGTDGEQALEAGFESVFPIYQANNKSIHLRCFSHVQDDMLRELQKLQAQNKDEIISGILGRELGSTRVLGLVHTDTKENFNALYENMAIKWPPKFKQYIETKQGHYRSLKDSL
jgi:hypothetical protein